MKRFILKSSLFVAPAFLSYFTYLLIGSASDGDLIRMGYLPKLPKNYFAQFAGIAPRTINYQNFSEVKVKKRFRFLSIGDSFSQQGIAGYQNFISQNKEQTLAHLNTPANSNPIKYLYKLINGNALDSIHPDYLILQIVERSIASHRVKVDTLLKIDYPEAGKLDQQSLKDNREVIKRNEENKHYFFSDAVIKFPFYNLFYLFDDHAFFSKTYKVNTTKSMFSVTNEDLRFLDTDLKCIPANNDPKNLSYVNAQLNDLAGKLKKKNIKLILLVSPNKYSLYYPYLVEKEKYPEPMFFRNFEGLPKDYLYVKANEILKNAVGSKKDIYHYGDTHWSPIACELVAEEILKLAENDEKANISEK